MFEISPYDTNV